MNKLLIDNSKVLALIIFALCLLIHAISLAHGQYKTLLTQRLH